MVLADKAYSSRAIRTCLRRRANRAVIPQPSHQTANRKRPGEATRYDKTAWAKYGESTAGRSATAAAVTNCERGYHIARDVLRHPAAAA